MALPHPLPDEIVEVIARRFRVLSEPTRIKLLDQLHGGESSVQELCEQTGTTQQNVSKHLAVLADAGIVARRRVGSVTRYRVVDAGVYQLCEDVCASIERRLDELRGAFRET
jgi:DNA-binding transcriptional ArsR family regulator